MRTARDADRSAYRAPTRRTRAMGESDRTWIEHQIRDTLREGHDQGDGVPQEPDGRDERDDTIRSFATGSMDDDQVSGIDHDGRDRGGTHDREHVDRPAEA